MRSERWMLVIFGLILLGLLTAEIVTDYSPAKLSILFFLLFWAPLLVLHEAGHALATLLVGWRVSRVVIGFGKPIWRFNLGRTPVEVCLLPLEGFTQLEPSGGRLQRLKHFLVYAAGPGIEIATLGLLAMAVGLEELLTRTESIPLIASQSLAVAILLGLVSNLIPHSVECEGGRRPNDGLGMFLSLTARPLS